MSPSAITRLISSISSGLAARKLCTNPMKASGPSSACAIWAVLGLAAMLGFTKAETERIWLFLAPYVCLAAAPLVTRRGLMPLLAMLAGQALLAEALFGTPW